VKEDVVSVIEAAYGPEEDSEWVRRIADVTAPALDRGYGVFVALYDTSQGCLRVGSAYGVGANANGAELLEATHAALDPKLLARLYGEGPYCSIGRQRAGLTHDAYTRNPVRIETQSRSSGGCQEALGVITGDPGGVGCMIMAPMKISVPVPRPLCTLWTKVAAHLAAAVRLRGSAARVHEADAVLSPSGRVEHAQGAAREADARQALSNGVARIDRARGPLRRKDPDEAVSLWRALVAGQWSLVEHFDTDGKRYLLARRNEGPKSNLATLSLLERQALALAALGHTNKLIAYQLGLTPSAVAMRLSRVAKKLGVRTRVQLIEQGAKIAAQPRWRRSSVMR
jgi:DNA-binding CsgD family transcriptional regulator